MKKLLFALCIVLFSSQISLAQAPVVFFENLKDGQVIGTSYQLKMGVKGMKVAPAGQIVEGEGHHHLIIDGSPIEKGQVVPADATHIHFGKGQTEMELLLTAGKHTLTLQFANGAHLSYGKEMSATITVEVQNDLKVLR